VKHLIFVVQGSRGDEYQVTFGAASGRVVAYCSCPAGENGSICKHRLAIMDGEVSNLLSGNAQDVIRLQGLLKGTELEAAYTHLRVMEEEFEAAKRKLELAKKALASTMHRKVAI